MMEQMVEDILDLVIRDNRMMVFVYFLCSDIVDLETQDDMDEE